MTHPRIRKGPERLVKRTNEVLRVSALLTCERSGKRTFRSKAAADRETRKIKATGQMADVPRMATYACKWCGKWHMATKRTAS